MFQGDTSVVVRIVLLLMYALVVSYVKVQVGKDQEKAQSEKDSHSKLFLMYSFICLVMSG